MCFTDMSYFLEYTEHRIFCIQNAITDIYKHSLEEIKSKSDLLSVLRWVQAQYILSEKIYRSLNKILRLLKKIAELNDDSRCIIPESLVAKLTKAEQHKNDLFTELKDRKRIFQELMAWTGMNDDERTLSLIMISEFKEFMKQMLEYFDESRKGMFFVNQIARAA